MSRSPSPWWATNDRISSLGACDTRVPDAAATSTLVRQCVPCADTRWPIPPHRIDKAVNYREVRLPRFPERSALTRLEKKAKVPGREARLAWGTTVNDVISTEGGLRRYPWG